MQNFTATTKSIHEVSELFKQGALIIDDSYQRRSVWGEKDKIRLIETVLLNLIIPELFFWKADTDPETGEAVTHIVDGQQRINAISSFVNNKLKLKPQYLLDETTKAKYSDMLFSDLPLDIKKDFWNYTLRIIEFPQEVGRDDIVKIFRRLNLTDYSLNDQEKRNSISGIFTVLAREISDNPIWEKYNLFKVSDVKRMKDVEFCASLILLYKKGIIDQTDQTALNQAYSDYQLEYDEAESDKESILQALEMLKFFLDDPNILLFLRRKAQLYTFFCILFSMLRKEKTPDDNLKTNLRVFVDLYALFDNDMEPADILSDHERKIFDILKKYKLASSEGLNKYSNRMIRFSSLNDFLFNSDLQTAEAAATLGEKLKKSVKDDSQAQDISTKMLVNTSAKYDDV